jgi:putative spermidine/putrescine transport system permease protein
MAQPAGAILYAVVGLILVVLIAPSLIVVPMSFSSSRFLQFPPPGFSTQWYEAYLGSREWMNATWNSLQIGAATALLSTVFGTTAALGLRQMRVGRAFITAIMIAPMIVPGIVLAITIYFFFVRFNQMGIPLVGSRLGLVLAHTVLALPYVFITVSASLKGLDVSLEQAAASLGAPPTRVFRSVTLPLVRPGILSGALFAFITSFDELIVAIFLSGAHVRTLPVKMWEGVRFELNPTLAAVSTILVVMSVGVLGGAEWFRHRARHNGRR